MLVLDTPVNSIFFAQITGYIYVDYLFKCYTQLRYAENSTTCAPLRVPQNSRKKNKVKHSDQLGYTISDIFLRELLYVFIVCP